jgi:heme-degrading monooxygenase HmoA
MILTLFRSRLKADCHDEYDEQVSLTAPLAETTPGFLGHKVFVAEDGERLTVVEFDSMEAQRAWSLSRAHTEAAKVGRKRFYAEYKVQVCSVVRTSTFSAPPPPPAPAEEARHATCLQPPSDH